MPFFHSPRTSVIRPCLLTIHLCAGLSIGALALVAGLSGAALVYAPELELAAHRTADPSRPPLSLDALAATALASHSEFRLQDIRFDATGAPSVLHIQSSAPRPNADDEPAAPRADLHLLLDPATGTVVRAVDRRAGAWGFLRRLHHDLLAGRTGRAVNGIGAAALLALCITGAIIWWPGPALWARRVRVARTTNWKRANWDLHNAVGFWLAAGLACFALSGIHFAFPGLTRGAIALAGGNSAAAPKPRLAPPSASPGAAASARASLDSLAARARAAVPGAELRQLKLPRRRDEPVEARLKTAFDGHAEGHTRLFLDPRTTGVIRIDRFEDLPAGRKAVLLAESLHMARFMSPGWPGVIARVPWLLLGLAPGLLFLTGFLMWWNRVASKRLAALAARHRPPHQFPARARARLARVLGSLMALACLAAVPASVFAQPPALSGLIVDASGGAVAGAAVTLFGARDRTTRSAADGTFTFAAVAPGPHLVSVAASGFETQTLHLEAGVSAIVRLDVAGFSETVVVNAGTLDQRLLDDPVPATGITRQDIATRNNRLLSDVLARMPGVFLTGPPGTEKDLRLRGLDKEFSRTQIDGVTIPDGGEKRELQLNRVSSSAVESVRIIRNPTAEFESDGLAGRVEVRTRPIADTFRIDGRIGAGAHDLSGAGLSQGQLFLSARPRPRWGMAASLNMLGDEVPIDRHNLLPTRATESEVERRNITSWDVFGDIAAYTDRVGELHAKPMLLSLDTAMRKTKAGASAAGLATSRTDEREDKRQQTRGLSFTHRAARASGLVWDALGAWFDSSEDKDKTTHAFKAAGGLFTPDKRTVEAERKADRTWNVAVSLAWPAGPERGHDLKVGVALRARTRFRDKTKTDIAASGAATDTTGAKDRYHLTEDYQAVFAQDRWRIADGFSLMPGLRLERVQLVSATPVDEAAPRVFFDANPSAHAVWNLARTVSVHAAVSKGLARPKFDELSPFESVSATKIVTGNPDLEPTRGWNYDAGLQHATPRLTLAASVFYKQLSGIIEEVDTGEDRDSRNVFRVENVGDGWVRGIEFEQRLRPAPDWPSWIAPFSLWANQTMLASRLRPASGQARPFKEQPPWIVNAGLDFVHARLGTSVSIVANAVARRFDYKANGDVSAKAGSTAMELAVHQRLRGPWRLFVEVSNLTGRPRVEDEMFLNGTAGRKLESYGRTILAGLQYGL